MPPVCEPEQGVQSFSELCRAWVYDSEPPSNCRARQVELGRWVGCCVVCMGWGYIQLFLDCVEHAAALCGDGCFVWGGELFVVIRAAADGSRWRS